MADGVGAGAPAALAAGAGQVQAAEEERRQARAAWLRENPRVGLVFPPLDALIASRLARGLSPPQVEVEGQGRPSSFVVQAMEDGRSVFHTVRLAGLEWRRSEEVPLERLLARAAERLHARAAAPENNPLAEAVRAASGAPAVAKTLLWPDRCSGPDGAAMGEHWDLVERAAAGLHLLRERQARPLEALRACLRRPLGMILGLWPELRQGVPALEEYAPDPHDPHRVRAYDHHRLPRVHFEGGVALPLGRVERELLSLDGTAVVVAALLWLKAALRQGEFIELQEGPACRLVLTDLRGLVVEVTGWVAEPGNALLNVLVPMNVDPPHHSGPRMWGAFRTTAVRYCDKVTYPNVLWLGAERWLFKVAFHTPDALLDWAPLTAAEQAAMRADDVAREEAEDDADDDVCGGGGNWPSTTGNPSGGGRGNA